MKSCLVIFLLAFSAVLASADTEYNDLVHALDQDDYTNGGFWDVEERFGLFSTMKPVSAQSNVSALDAVSRSASASSAVAVDGVFFDICRSLSVDLDFTSKKLFLILR